MNEENGKLFFPVGCQIPPTGGAIEFWPQHFTVRLRKMQNRILILRKQLAHIVQSIKFKKHKRKNVELFDIKVYQIGMKPNATCDLGFGPGPAGWRTIRVLLGHRMAFECGV